jgi:hypothetical protein
MTSDDRSAAEAAFACAALLDQGRKLQALSLVLTGVAILAALGPQPGRPQMQIAVAASILLGVVALYFAIRVGLDARLMHRLAVQADDGRLDLARFDAGLTLAGLRPATASTRTLGDRIAGASALLRNQALATAAQLVVLVGGALLWLGGPP